MFSATSNQRTFSKNNRRKAPNRRTGRRAPGTGIRFRGARALQSSEDGPVNPPRITNKLGRLFPRGKSLLKDVNSGSVTRVSSRGRVDAGVEEFGRHDYPVKTSVITRFVRGTAGEYHKTVSTLTIYSTSPGNRFKRNVKQPAKHITDFDKLTNILKYSGRQIKPEEIIKLLKKSDKNSLKGLLKSLQRWIQYYSEEILEDKKPRAPELSSSMSSNFEHSFSQPNSKDLCPRAVTETKTIYKTVYRDRL